MMRLFGSSKQIDTIVYNEDNKPIIVSDIIHPKALKLKTCMKVHLHLKLLVISIKEKIFYIPEVNDLSIEIIQNKIYKKKVSRDLELMIQEMKEYIECL